MNRPTKYNGTRYAYVTGLKSREAAQDKLESMFAEGDVSEGERPQIEYVGGSKPYIITLEG